MMFNDINVKSFDNIIPSGSIMIENEFINELKAYNENSKINLNKDEYRKRINILYNELEMIKPIDNEIDDVIYYNDYEKNGLVINKKDISLKQVWTEYRLMYNEKVKEEDMNMGNNSFVLDNFDELFEKISKKVDGLDKYINDLNSLKSEIDTDSVNLKNNRENFEIEKITFENYKREETARLEMLEKEMNNKIEKLNNLIKLFDEKISGLKN